MSWKIDSAHAQVEFSVRHMMITNVRGRFERFEGTVDVDEQHPETAKVDVKIEAASISTRESKRDAHLRSPDFLNADEFPYIEFKSKHLERLDDAHARLYGDLTIRGVTHEVALDVEYTGQQRMWGKVSAGFSASTKINRKHWGLNWNMALETGGLLVGEEIKVEIEMELVREEQPAAEAVA